MIVQRKFSIIHYNFTSVNIKVNMAYCTIWLIKEHFLNCELVNLLMLLLWMATFTIGTATVLLGSDLLVLPW